MNTAHALTSVEPEYEYLFSVCTLVNNLQEYELMKSTFEQFGFTGDCEYLFYDNSETNVVDAYQAISGFLRQARGKYIIAVHQDVRCLDSKEHLIGCLQHLTQMDSKWAVCGNAGCNDYHEQVRYLENAGKLLKDEGLPRQVKSLDENLLIIKQSANLSVSGDLSGYHFYGTDLCIIADLLGYTSYVVPFMVQHLSMGGSKGFWEAEAMFKHGYGYKLRNRYIETTCARFYLSNGRFKTKLYNAQPFYTFVKAGLIIKKFLRKLS